jgi:hypothetical protein
MVLADNEDDEKRLLLADAHAGKKLKPAQRGGRGAARKSFPRRNSWGPRSLGSGMAAGASQFIPQSANMYSPVAASQHNFTRSHGQVGVSPPTIGPCFECGMPGHYRKYCPKLISKVPGAVSKYNLGCIADVLC